MCVSPNPATCGGIVGLFDLQGVKTAVTVAPDDVACVVPCDNDCAAFGMACDEAHDICVWAL